MICIYPDIHAGFYYEKSTVQLMLIRYATVTTSLTAGKTSQRLLASLNSSPLLLSGTLLHSFVHPCQLISKTA